MGPVGYAAPTRLLGAVLGGLLLAACGGGGSAPSLDAAEVQAGAGLFARYCASCHGENGSGGHMTPPVEALTLQYGESQAEIARTVAKGRPMGMPAFGEEMDEKQLRSVAAYVLSLR